MAKVLILAEGQTEENFIKRVLNPHLEPQGVTAIPTIVATKRVKSGSDFKGGVPSYRKVRKEIKKLLADTSASLVTTMLDFYGLPNSFPGRAKPEGKSARERVSFVENAISKDIAADRFEPYLSLHEFEALLFVSPDQIADAFAEPTKRGNLLEIRKEFKDPEEINDDPSTAPSKRLEDLFPNYSKPLYGALIAGRITLNEMRKECAHFNEWVTRLENLR